VNDPHGAPGGSDLPGTLSDWEVVDRENWNRLALLHARSDFYDVAGFKAGKLSLQSLEREEVGDVAGKSLLHLQCHFGMDTLSWARLGARVTGVDYAPNAIALARDLSREIGVPGDFVCCSIYDLPHHLSGQFDIVFTSYGVLCWLPDLTRWGHVIDHFLKPGGFFYIADGHPLANIFYNEPDATELRIAYPYFHRDTPEAYETQGSYATADDRCYTGYEWSHSLSDVVNALLNAGLRLEFLHEFPFGFYQHLPFMVQGPDGRWRLPEHGESVPLIFSLKAVKPLPSPNAPDPSLS
jgi:SAM-dependent methyltransferase